MRQNNIFSWLSTTLTQREYEGAYAKVPRKQLEESAGQRLREFTGNAGGSKIKHCTYFINHLFSYKCVICKPVTWV